MMRIFYFILLGLMSSSASAFEVIDWQTDSGARAYFVQRPELPLLDVRIIFDAGSARDDKDYGLANLTTAMLNQGANGLSSDQLAKIFDDNGAEYGISVTRDMSIVSLRVLTDTDLLNNALNVFTTIVGQPDFPTANLQRLVKAELTSIKKGKKLPAEIASRAFNRALFGNHPYAHPIGGEEDTLANITPSQLRKFRNQYLTAQNAIIILVGDISPDQAKQVARQISAVLPQGQAVPPVVAVEKPQAQRIDIPFDSAQAHIYIGQIGMAFDDSDFFPLYMANRIFGGSGFASRLVQEVRVKYGYAYSIWSYFSLLAAKGAFTIGFQTAVEQAPQAVDLTLDMLNELHQRGVNQKELDLAKDSVRGGFALRIASNKDIARWVGNIAFYNLERDYLKTFVPQVEQLDRATIQSALMRRIELNDLIIVTVGGR